MYSISKKNKKIIYSDDIENVKITIDEDNYLGLIDIHEPLEIKWPGDFLDAFMHPIKSKTIHELAKGAKQVALIVSDSTRGVPTSIVIPFIIQELEIAGISLNQIVVVIALGVHRPATKKEITEIIGYEYVDSLKIINHDPYDEKKLINLGKTSLGTPVEINKTIYQSDFRIIIGKVEAHEFAGFSGGRKSVLPGISSEKSIKINHRPEMLLKRGSIPGELKDNFINKDMIEAAKMLGIHYSVNFVVNGNGQTIGLFTDDPFDAHQKAVEFVISFCKVKIKEKPDIILTTPGFPLNIDFYQSIKPLISLQSILSEGGIIALYALCPDGFNSDDMLLPFEGTDDIDEVMRNLTKNYQIQMDHALFLCKILKKKIKIIATSPNVKGETFKKIFIEPASSPQKAVEKALKISGKNNPKLLIFPQPQRTLPYIQ